MNEESSTQEARNKLNLETAKIPWTELQRWFASGAAVYVAPELDLIDVALQMSRDNTARVQPWMASGLVARVSDEQALSWSETNATLWALVVKPWVLVQPLSSRGQTED